MHIIYICSCIRLTHYVIYHDITRICILGTDLCIKGVVVAVADSFAHALQECSPIIGSEMRLMHAILSYVCKLHAAVIFGVVPIRLSNLCCFLFWLGSVVVAVPD